MNAFEALQAISEMAHIAGEYLVLARVKAQEAVVLQDTLSAGVYVGGIEKTISLLRQRARKYREYARQELVDIEKLNGMLYSNGEDWLPLKHELNGRRFREWPAYKNVYARSELFRGVDPN